MLGGNYASVVKLITEMYDNYVDDIDRAHASVLLECIKQNCLLLPGRIHSSKPNLIHVVVSWQLCINGVVIR